MKSPKYPNAWKNYPNPQVIPYAQALGRLLVRVWGALSLHPVILTDFDAAQPLPKPLIIAANHQSILDPFAIAGFIPNRVFRRIQPVRFMTGNGFLQLRVIGRLGWIIGCFPAQTALHVSYGTRRAQEILASGGTVVIFPEGRRTLARQSPAKAGIIMLAEFPTVWIMPVHVNWHLEGGKRRLVLRYGQPRQSSGQTAQEWLNTIYDLPLPATPRSQ